VGNTLDAGFARIPHPRLGTVVQGRADGGFGRGSVSTPMANTSASQPFVPRPAEGLAHPNVVAMFAARAERSGNRPALRHKQSGAWRTLSWEQWQNTAREAAAGLVGMGVKQGDRIAILSRSQVHWVLADLACAIVGAVSVPIYPSLTPQDTAYILGDSGATVAFVDTADRLRVELDLPDSAEQRDDAKPVQLRHIVVFDGGAEPELDVPRSAWDALVADGAAALRAGEAAATLEATAHALGLEDPLTIVYTSGTTGEPKGAVLTHGNLVYESWALHNVVPLDRTDEQLMVLPLAHIFARHLVWGAVEQGAITAFAESDDRTMANLQELAPTFIGGVPRMYEDIYAQVRAEAASRGGLSKTMLEYALDTGRRVSVCKQRGQAVPTALAVKMAVADRLVFRRLRGMFGGRIRFLVSGGAALSRDIAEFFHAAGMLVLEGYGLSETSGATNVNRPERFRFGTVGPAMPGCEVRIADDGEVLIRGANVMARYHNRPQDSAAAFDGDGWFRTGDLGEIRDGFLQITGRKKNLFKTTNGKYVAPLLVEKRLRVRPGIAYAVVCGDGRPYPIALVSLDEDHLLDVSEHEGLGCRSYADLAVHPRIRQLVQQGVDAVNDTLARHERVRRFAILRKPMTEATGELTPTRKVKRTVVSGRYEAVVTGLYDEA